MSIDREDPRLTAYALGEMDGREREGFEALLASDPEAQEEVASIRAVAGRLETELAAEPAPVLMPAQRQTLAAAARPKPASRRTWIPLSIAASVLVVGGVLGALGELAGGGGDQGFRVVDESPEALRDRAIEVAMKDEEKVRESEEERMVFRREAVGGDELEPADQIAEVTVDMPGARDPADPNALVVSLPPAGGRGRYELDVRLPPGGSTGAEEEAHGARPPFHTEGYDRIRDNPFVRTSDQHTSTFSIDVDTASYANVRRFLMQQGQLPPPDAVRIEELVNYFPYAYAPPPRDAEHPFAAHVLVAGCPWAPDHRLVRVALKGQVMEEEERPAANLVFLLDVSGSMKPANKLPLLKQAMALLVDRLDEGDRVSIVVYAGAAGLVLPPTAGDRKAEILAALDRLRSGGSTNGGAGIQLAYRTAREAFVEGGANRVILCTDGDFNVGVSDRGSLTRLIEEEAKSGVFLTVLGFGMGNYKDDRMEELSNRGNGNYGYVDTLREAQKLLVDEGLSTLVTIAKDVKIQIFFNPAQVEGWRLIGYENRLLRAEDFNDDTKDAGEIGAGHAVTALYEIVPAGQEMPGPVVDANPFVTAPEPSPAADTDALLRLRLRYKAPDGDTSTLMEHDVRDEGTRFGEADPDLQWAATVAAFGMLLRDSPYKGDITWAFVEEIGEAAGGRDPQGHRAEFLEMVERAASFSAR
ncbi:MAG: YfbK domain-containing protein [Planctomycetota bacterium]|jgi:Ca-activated chloride channel family protein